MIAKLSLEEIVKLVKSDSDLGRLHDQVVGRPLGEMLQSRLWPGETVFKSFDDLQSSVEKQFHYVSGVATHPFTVEVEGNIHSFEPPSEVVVSENLFRQYSCLDYGCSKCCKKTRFWNIWSLDEREKLKSMYPEEQFLGDEMFFKVNGVPRKFYVEDKTQHYCDHIDHEGEFCRVHLMNPLHCMFPLMKFKQVKKTGKMYITREYFGRNWNMQCPAKFQPMTEVGLESTIYMLNRLKSFSESMGIETQVESITRSIKSKFKESRFDIRVFFGGEG